MNEDEKYVREHWINPRFIACSYRSASVWAMNLSDTYITIIRGNTQDECWAKARKFTEERQEEVRCLEREIDILIAVRSDWANQINEVREYATITRTLTRIKKLLATAKLGIRA